MNNDENTHLKRCKECNRWTDGKSAICAYCGHDHDKVYREEVEKRKLNGDVSVPVLKINESDALWLKIVKKPIQVFQLILYALIGFLIYLSTAFAH
ncbi:MAG: hypothetical protein NWS74_01890 [Salibacteraceae bacterium]|nr:hypothetical protein [Salibacteraceae bacterium]MDP4685326.1 hypothetical protein [Salibacteraceae bacterium]MDP4762078.1 hypothetical protein [Salibacteraceae bacterium]